MRPPIAAFLAFALTSLAASSLAPASPTTIPFFYAPITLTFHGGPASYTMNFPADGQERLTGVFPPSLHVHTLDRTKSAHPLQQTPWKSQILTLTDFRPTITAIFTLPIMLLSQVSYSWLIIDWQLGRRRMFLRFGARIGLGGRILVCLSIVSSPLPQSILA
jgi:hypothetical protein